MAARAAAAPKRHAHPGREALPTQYLTFFVGEHEYAIEILMVREVLEYEAVTPVPLTPACIRGVMNVRGSAAPIIDLAFKFTGQSQPTTMKTCVVMVELAGPDGKTAMGIVADSVNRISEFSDADISAPPAFGIPIHIEYLKALGKVGRGFVYILDIEKVLSTEELLAVSALDNEDARAERSS